MNKNIPIFKNKITDIKYKPNIFCYVCKNNIDIESKIKNIFNNNFVYKADVNIMLKNNKNIKRTIVGYKNKKLITIDNEKIDVSEIYDIN